jgi:hypothetical protein
MASRDYGRWITDPRAEDAFDELALGLSREAISRGRALKLAGAALVGGALSIFALADDAEAADRRRRRIRRQKRRCRDHCRGCCDPFGRCKSGREWKACGTEGEACQRCHSRHCDRTLGGCVVV